MSMRSIRKRPAAVSRLAFMALFMIMAATLHLSAAPAQAAQTTLSWVAPTTYTDGTSLTTLKGYKVYAGTSSGSYAKNVDVGNVTSYTMSGLNDGTTYYFAVTAYDSAGTVSGFSNQVSFTTPAAPPTANLYTLSATAGSGGTISPSGSVVISQGGSQSYAISPSTGYKIAGVAVDGASVGAVASYTFSNVTANHTIAATFASTTSGGGTTLTSSSTWQSQTIAKQSGAFAASFDLIPQANNIDAGTGFSAAAAASWSDLATIVRFNTSGTIDARNGSSYAAKVAIPYSAGKVYRIRMQIDVPNHRYDVYVTPQGGSETQLASGYAFRTEQAGVASLGDIDVYAGTGSHQLQNLSIAAAPATYTLSASAGTGGSISPAGSTTVASGASQTYGITPATGYKVAGVTVDGASVGAVTSYTFSNVTANHSIAATFTPVTYTLSASAGTGGSISPAGSTTVASGASQTYGITPATGYKVAGVTVDGASVGAVTSYTFSNVTANHTIAASFASTTTGGGTTLTSSSTWQSQTIARQSGAFTASFDLIPQANNIDAGTGFSTAAAASWSDLATIVRFNTSGTIDARNGSGYAAKVAIPYSAGKVYRIRMQIDVPNHRYDVYVTPQGGSETQLASGYAFRTEQAGVASLGDINVYAGTGSHQLQNLSVTAAPATASYSLTSVAGSGGSISPAGTITVSTGSSKTYSIVPASGYKIAGVTVDGTSVGAVSSYNFSNITANHTISATFAPVVTYTISAKAYSNGSISPSGNTAVASGASQSYTITPSSGYQVSAVKVDGVSVGRVTSYTFKNVTANHSIAVSFKIL